MIDPALLVENLLTPAVLCFALGVAARAMRSEMTFPKALSDGLAIYLLFAIGLKGGASLRAGGEGFIAASLLTIFVGLLIPALVYLVVSRLKSWSRAEAASMAAHYGSTSAVTFLAAMAFADRQGLETAGFMPAILAIMEVPAIVIGLVLARHAETLAAARQPTSSSSSQSSISAQMRKGAEKQPLGTVIYQVLTGKTLLLLIGGMIIGVVAHPASLQEVKPFFTGPFKGALALYLLDLGLIAGAALPLLVQRWKQLVPFGILAPLVNGSIGVTLASMIGLAPGSALVFGILAGSASYIAAPAAMRMAYPDVNHGVSLAASLGVTFPFNLALGIPILAALAEALAG